MMLQVEWVVGSNIVLVWLYQNIKEYVLIGKGLGFVFKVESIVQVDDLWIEKRFWLEDWEEWGQVQELMKDLDFNVIDIFDWIICFIVDQFFGKLNDNIYFVFLSYIQFILYCICNGMEILNFFFMEIKFSFLKEFEFVLEVVVMIGEVFGVEVLEDEVGFLIYYVYFFVNYVFVGQLVKVFNVISKFQFIIEDEGGV